MVDGKCRESYYFMGVVLNPIFNNISAISWRSVLTGKTLSHNVTSSHEQDSNSQH